MQLDCIITHILLIIENNGNVSAEKTNKLN